MEAQARWCSANTQDNYDGDFCDAGYAWQASRRASCQTRVRYSAESGRMGAAFPGLLV